MTSRTNSSQVKVVLESSEGNVELIFDGRNTDKFNWFSKSRLLSSPWKDISTEPQNFFSIEGTPHEKRSFHINRNWGGCPQDACWLAVADGGPLGYCEWERAPEDQLPYIRFSKTTVYANYNGGNIATADRMVIYIDTPGNNVLCSCPAGQSLSEDGTRCDVSPVTEDQLRTLVSRYAPKVWLAKGEKYNPSSIDFHLQHVKVYDGRRVYSSTPSTLPTCTETCYMSTVQPLPHAEATLPFFSGEQIGPTRQPPVYAVVKRVNAITTDIFYWMFFPYNLGKKVCVGDKIFGCIGKNQTLAHRVSDWEHMTIRLVGKTPSSIYVDSAETSSGIYNWHGTSQTYRKGEDVVLTEGTHPILYSAYGNHKLWPSSATRTFMARLIKTLKDETSAGTAWDTWKNVRFTMYQPDGGYTGNWTWMNFKGLWGNKEVNWG
ncbi:PREDICTED: putative vacuolar protein sorting-associated protein TDA6 [Branchiostoma belcheri]|uniref:Vacuolar protein sorting-associated protein TDA6 n=1 Tax=Branchiostoma belcheri TaxID=7741 RepID=A0A6P4ZAD6_BRABE|nr:PREDICTED: putative vacuolar protein sorting-associated protein TDA6 [Branchiostoma belcheri]